MMKRILLTMAMAVSTLSAQEGGGTLPPPPPPVVVKLVHLKYAEANPVGGLFSNTGVSIKSDGYLNSVVLRGDPKAVDEVERLIREVDVPESAQRPSRQLRPNLDLQVYVVAGSDVGGDNPLPKVLEPAVSQLKSMFPYRGYQLLETIQNRVAAGEIAVSTGTLAQLIPASSSQFPVYDLEIDTNSMPEANSPADLKVKFQAFSHSPATVSNGVNVPERQIKSNIQTRFTLNPGQLVVVGKSGYGDASLFLIMSVKVTN